MKKGKHDVRLSKQLSSILRHQAVKLKLDITSDGFVNIEDLLKLPVMIKLHSTMEELQAVVDDNDKKRFEISSDGKKIRALQGHTMKVVHEEGLMEPILDPEKYPVVIHGTYTKCWREIFRKGLSRMKRNHIHMAQGYPEEGNVISGMRRTCDVFIEINLAKALKDGIKFYESKNKVILTSGIEGKLPCKYFSKVISGGKILFEGSKPFSHLVVLGLAQNCSFPKTPPLKFQDIIEFAAVVIDAEKRIIMDTFHKVISPSISSHITPYALERTGINLKEASPIPIQDCIGKFMEFLQSLKIPLESTSLIGSGDWELKNTLQKESKAKNFPLPDFLSQWINLKKIFPVSLFRPELEELKISNDKEISSHISEMKEAFKISHVPYEGKEYSALDAAKNISRIIQGILEKGFKFTPDFLEVL